MMCIKIVCHIPFTHDMTLQKITHDNDYIITYVTAKVSILRLLITIKGLLYCTYGLHRFFKDFAAKVPKALSSWGVARRRSGGKMASPLG